MEAGSHCERDIFKLENHHSLENLASKQNYQIVKHQPADERMARTRRTRILRSRPCDHARPPCRTGSHHRATWAAGGLVEPAGIEPATFWLQTRRSPS